MTESEALIAIKCECKVLSEALTDAELIYFLNKNSKDTGSALENNKLYNMNRAIYDALRSAITALPASFSRGGVSYSRGDLTATLKEFQRKSLIGNSDFPRVGIGVIVRDISN